MLAIFSPAPKLTPFQIIARHLYNVVLIGHLLPKHKYGSKHASSLHTHIHAFRDFHQLCRNSLRPQTAHREPLAHSQHLDSPILTTQSSYLLKSLLMSAIPQVKAASQFPLHFKTCHTQHVGSPFRYSALRCNTSCKKIPHHTVRCSTSRSSTR